jgi:predicted nucleic acid-binding Zn ribbon protein
VRRRAPRPLAEALTAFAGASRPATLLAQVQSAWRAVAGDAVASEAEPVSERSGVVTVSCRSAVWAQELELLAPDLVERLNAALAPPARVDRLRFRADGGAKL